MLQRTPKNHTVIDMYKAYTAKLLADNPKYHSVYDDKLRISGIRTVYLNDTLIMSYTMFRLLIETFNKYAAEGLIQGNRIDLGGNLGSLYPIRIERSFNKLKCDVVATRNARKQNPAHPTVYYLTDDYCLIRWQKNKKVRNESVYSFMPAKHSLREQFFRAIRLNPSIKLNYIFVPRKQAA